jgi:hypothetical protein
MRVDSPGLSMAPRFAALYFPEISFPVSVQENLLSECR